LILDNINSDFRVVFEIFDDKAKGAGRVHSSNAAILFLVSFSVLLSVTNGEDGADDEQDPTLSSNAVEEASIVAPFALLSLPLSKCVD